jgi:hypothetical protein
MSTDPSSASTLLVMFSYDSNSTWCDAVISSLVIDPWAATIAEY